MYSLLFFSMYLLACHPATESDFTIHWDNKRATGIVISEQLVEGIDADSLNQLLSIRLAGQTTAMAGQLQSIDTGVLFEPLVSFTRGRTYTVWLRNKPLGEFSIPALTASDRPHLVGIYPSADSLPENLLKVYLHFSQSMREGQSANYIALLNSKGDTVRDVFLDLQPELWNADRTMLTLWLDPGRIKRDLQPNQRLGAPLQVGSHYQLVVSAGWPDALGAPLPKAGRKNFLTIRRDDLSPVVSQWAVRAPRSGTAQPLTITFGEPLDYYLLTETLHIRRDDGTAVAGSWQAGSNEAGTQFIPSTVWLPGRYRLRIESRLEDLAGNNLNRPFDRDITNGKEPANRPFHELIFDVK